MRPYQYTPNIISKNQNNVLLREVHSLVTPTFSYRAVDGNPLVLALGLSLLLSLLSFSFFPQLPTLFPMPSSPPTALGWSLSFTYRLFGSACLNTEELRWGSPTATPPFEPLDFAPKGSGRTKGVRSLFQQ